MKNATPLIARRTPGARFSPSLTIATLAAVLFPTGAMGQVAYTGNPATQNFGSQAIGSTSAARTLSFSIAAGTTVGSIELVIQGVPNLDFATAPGGTCAAQAYPAEAACTLNLTFKPKAVGRRAGAVLFFAGPSNTGSLLGNVPIYGVGTGALLTYGLGGSSDIATGAVGGPYGPSLLESPGAMAVDGAGNLFVSDYMGTLSSWGLVEVPVGGGALKMAAYEPGPLSGMAFDGAGDLLYTWSGCNCVSGSPSGPIAPTVNGKTLNGPAGLAVDGAGDLFIADSGNNRVVMVPAGGGAATAIDPTVDSESLSGPGALALDGAGNLYIVDGGNGRVVEVPADGGSATAIDPVVFGSGLGCPNAIAVDAAGDLFISNGCGFYITEAPAGGGPPVPMGGGEDYEMPTGLAVDSAGDVFQSWDSGSGGPIEFSDLYVAGPSTTAPALNFPTPTNVGSIDTPDGTQTVPVVNSGNTALTFTALSYPADFSAASGDPLACSPSTVLSPGQLCDLPVQFTPQHSGTLKENVTLTDNSLNVTGTQQSIAVTGTGVNTPATLTSPVPGSTLSGSAVAFSWTPRANATGYYLSLGSTGVGSSNLFNTGWRTVTSWTATGLPDNAETIYARLSTNFSGTILYTDYTYMAGGGAKLTSPVPGIAIIGSSAVFSWSASPGATGYYLSIGSTGVGSSNVFNSGWRTVTSWTASGLPANGETLYVRLTTNFNGNEVHSDYTYTSAGLAALTAPSPGTTLSGPSVPFTWTASPGATGYYLSLGSTGVGSDNLFNTGWRTTTTWTVTGLPVNGEKIYARLSTDFNGVIGHVDTTYTAGSQSVLTSPQPGSMLEGPSVTFTWTAVPGATAYYVDIGTTGVGSNNLPGSGVIAATSWTANGLPTSGQTIYVRLQTEFNGSWVHNDYTFQAQ